MPNCRQRHFSLDAASHLPNSQPSPLSILAGSLSIPRMLLRPVFKHASSVSFRLHLRAMATNTTFTRNAHNIPLSLPDGLSEDQLSSFKPFTVSPFDGCFKVLSPLLTESPVHRAGSTHSPNLSHCRQTSLTHSTQIRTPCAMSPFNPTISLGQAALASSR